MRPGDFLKRVRYIFSAFSVSLLNFTKQDRLFN